MLLYEDSKDDIILEDNCEYLLEGIILEADEVFELKQNVIKKLKNSRSAKERQKLLTRLKNLNKVKKVFNNKEE